MSKKKVTLSLDSKVYSDFQKYCEDNAIMLSKKIEIVMKSLLKGKKVMVLFFAMLFFISFLSVHALEFSDKNSSDFSEGTFSATQFNSSGFIQLSTDGLDKQLPNNGQSENYKTGANMSRNTLLLHLNELSGKIVDYSGNGNNGTSSGGVSYANNGKLNFSLSFDGVDDSVSIPNSNSLAFNDSYSIGFWINPSSDATQWKKFMEKENQFYFQFINSDKIRLQVFGYANVDSNSVIPRNSWTYVLATVENGAVGNDMIKIYINGQLDNSYGPAWGTPVAGNSNITIGSGIGEYFKGSFDEVVMFDRALTSYEVANVYDKQIRNHAPSGNYISKIFDAGNVAIWNNLSIGKSVNPRDYIYAVDANGAVYSSVDGGVSWNQRNSNYGRGAGTIDILSDNDYLYIVFSGTPKEVYRSSDYGVSWSLINNSFSSSSLVASAIDLDNNFFIVTGPGGVYKSNNSGLNWKLLSDFNGADSSNAKGIAINESNAIFIADSSRAVYSSINGGVNWSLATEDYGDTGTGISDLASDKGGNLYILNNKKVYISFNGGVNWSLATESFTNYANDGAKIYADSNNVLYLVDNVGRTFNSINNGTNWTELSDFNNGATATPKGLTNFLRETRVSVQTRNCSSSCLNEPFTGPDGSSNSYYENLTNLINKNGRYFQYKLFFESQDGEITPKVMNVSLIYGLLDNEGPSITIFSPANTTYSSGSIFINYSVSDQSSIDKCWYNVDSSINISLPSCLTASLSGLNEGSHEIVIYSNDTLGNSNYSRVRFRIDNTPPVWRGINNDYPSIYNPSYLSKFSINWSDFSDVESVWAESDLSGILKNYSMYLVSENRYEFNVSLPAGTFYWKSYAKDSLGNINSSSQQIIIVEKTSNPLEIYFNGNKNQNYSRVYGAEINVTGRSNYGEVNLFRNGIAVPNPDISIISSGTYEYKVNSSGNQNYSSNETIYYLDISRAEPSIKLMINGEESDNSIGFGSNVEINASIDSPFGGIVSLYEDGTLVLSDVKISINRNYSSLGDRVWTASYAGNQNYSSMNKSFQISILDPSGPQYSNIKTSYLNPVYSPSRIYQFNSTWTDNIEITDVIFEFNGLNRSYLNNEVSKIGDEYFVSLNPLAAGSYSYRWFGIDSSGNIVATQVQNYVVSQAISALFMSFSPSSSVTYGSQRSVSCTANNDQSPIVLTRGSEIVNNPDDKIVAVGSYNYACTSVATQNYSSASTTGLMVVSPAGPIMNLSLNGAEGDVTFGSEGGEVNITLSIILPENESVSLYVNNVEIGYGNSLFNKSVFSSVGVHSIKAYYNGSQNYTNGSLIRTVTVNAPASSSSGGGSGGGSSSGGGGGGSSFDSGGYSQVEIIGNENMIVGAGEIKRVSLIIKNNGVKFLNGCRIKGVGDYSSWISSDETKKIGGGEVSEFLVNINIPKETSSGKYSVKYNVECDEMKKESGVQIEVLEKRLGFNIIRTDRNEDSLIIFYSLEELSGIEQNVEMDFVLFDENNEKVLGFSKSVSLSPNEMIEANITNEISKELRGNFNLLVNINSEKYSTFVQENLVLGKAVSGLAIFSVADGEKIATPGIILFFVLFALFMGYRILKLRSEVKKHKKLVKAVKVKTNKIR